MFLYSERNTIQKIKSLKNIIIDGRPKQACSLNSKENCLNLFFCHLRILSSQMFLKMGDEDLAQDMLQVLRELPASIAVTQSDVDEDLEEPSSSENEQD
ncbi:unnamed protein product [Protopolystoma xenopodis]|uniref:Uncharacterized protein n=1 Tax=Protopolystoma xenopodis TaxID=117903 RepID=A0A3S5BG65_9PLAT|nr:unnamed protein product [Protopolystoma xenopodis]